ncbi:hypothetical protein C8R47DRAFT_1225327 [Mycena vitilis]|nr:hypothetical protein C8R47DRAFT_1225327 [Mycena vitilis]
MSSKPKPFGPSVPVGIPRETVTLINYLWMWLMFRVPLDSVSHLLQSSADNGMGIKTKKAAPSDGEEDETDDATAELIEVTRVRGVIQDFMHKPLDAGLRPPGRARFLTKPALNTILKKTKNGKLVSKADIQKLSLMADYYTRHPLPAPHVPSAPITARADELEMRKLILKVGDEVALAGDFLRALAMFTQSDNGNSDFAILVA